MQLERGSWWRFLSRALVLGVVVFGAVRLANARDGISGGAARSFVTVAGTVSGAGLAGTTQMMAFTFHRAVTAAMPTQPTLCAPTVSANVTTTGAFSVEVPLDSSASPCPANLFDGSDVQVDVAVGTTPVVSNANVNPVPYAHYASQYGTPDCPVGYGRNPTDAPPSVILCQKQFAVGVLDQIVRVGTGATAFWIDRYESSVEASTGLTVSRAGVAPQHSVSWFDANAACGRSGKRLPTGPEWLLAARGTSDPDRDEVGAEGRCVTTGTPRITGEGYPRDASPMLGCVSQWGAEDMIGNLREWTQEWFAAPSLAINISIPDAGTTTAYEPEGLLYPWGNGDVSGGIASSASATGAAPLVPGMPVAATRGGGADTPGRGREAGIYAMHMQEGPTARSGIIGFRCVIPR